MAKTVEAVRLKVKVLSPFQVFFEGSAVSVSAANDTGPFDILGNHSNFFSLVKPGIVAIDTGIDVVKIEISNGIITVTNNVVTLFSNM